MFGRILHMLLKEFLELRRDKWARIRLTVPPIVQVLIFGYAATFEVFHVSTAVLDLDRSQESRELIARFVHSDRFEIVKDAQSQHEIDAAINKSDAAVAVVIHAGFAAQLRKGAAAPVQVIVDGTNSNTALIGLGYVNEIASQYSREYAADFLQRTVGPQAARTVQISVEQRPQFNEDMNSRWFFVPGIIGTLTLVDIHAL